MKNNWTLVIEAKKPLFAIDFKDIWRYRDLLTMLVKRDVVTIYKQTILGPVWFFVQPILTMLVYTLVFANIAGLSTDGLPQPLFYLSGIIIWNYFLECFTQTSDTFAANQDLFGKVYFPRLIVPLSKVVSGLIKFLIQFVLFIAVWVYYVMFQDFAINWGLELFLVPLLLLLMAVYGLGFGLIFSSLTTKYRDLKFLIQFGVQLVMYATPIIYPVSGIGEKYKSLMLLNPIAHVVEGFRYVFLGSGYISSTGICFAVLVAIVVLVSGVFVFSKTEKDFIDTV